MAIIKLMMAMGLKNVVMTDRKGAIYEGREGLNPIKEEMAKITNRNMEKGTLADVIRGADVFAGVSAPGTLTAEMVKTMAKDPIIFACANPTPEIFPDDAKAAGAAVVSTGRSDYPNQLKQRPVLPRHLPGRAGCAGQCHHRGYEDRRRLRHCRAGQQGRTLCRLHPAQGI